MPSSVRKSAVVGAVLFVAGSAGAVARADDDPGARRAEAVQLGHKASEAYKAGNYAAALQEYEAAYKLVPAPPLVLNLSRTAVKLGRCDDAMSYAVTYSAAFAGSDTASVESPQTVLASVKSQCPEVRITSDPPGALLLIEGVPRSDSFATPWKGRLPVGKHTVHARLAGYPEQHVEVDAAPETLSQLRITFVGTPSATVSREAASEAPKTVTPPVTLSAPVTTHPAAKSSALRWEPFLPAGVAVVGLALAIAGGVLAGQCPTSVASPYDVGNAESCQYNRAGLADVGWGLAGAGAVTAGVLWLVLKPAPGSAESSAPVSVSVANGVTVAGRF